MPAAPPNLTPEERRWLHDKFERLAAQESELASSRTTYYAAIGTVLITGLVVTVSNLIPRPEILALVVTFLALLGVLISTVWIVLLHRTNDAKNLWRQAAHHLERGQPPISGEWRAPISLRTHEALEVNLLTPFLAHESRFSPTNRVSWMDKANPDRLTEVLPWTFLAMWLGVMVLVWGWYILFR